MSVQEYIESGILELYVFGSLTDEEVKEVTAMAEKHKEVSDEILAIESAVINLSYSVAPHLSAANYERIRRRLIDKHEGVIHIKAKENKFGQYLGWAASLLLLLGLGFQYYKTTAAEAEVQAVVQERSKFEQMLAELQVKNKVSEKALSVIRAKSGTVVALAGQAAAPEAYAKVYTNRADNQTYVDFSGLPEPPAGKVYQVWALKLNPLTPASIGVVSDKNLNNGIINVQNFKDAEAFGITLEPAGGSASPTLEQLYVLGKV